MAPVPKHLDFIGHIVHSLMTCGAHAHCFVSRVSSLSYNCAVYAPSVQEDAESSSFTELLPTASICKFDYCLNYFTCYLYMNYLKNILSFIYTSPLRKPPLCSGDTRRVWGWLLTYLNTMLAPTSGLIPG